MDPQITDCHSSTGAVCFFDLPDKARNQILISVLKVAHPIYLFQDGATQVESFVPERPFHWLALLLTSSRMHQEAAAVLFGTNIFMLLGTAREGVSLLKAFTNTIGDQHARLLQHLCITFPSIQVRPGSCTLDADGVQTFQLLREKCPNLETLEAHISGKDAIDLTKSDQRVPQFSRESLMHMNTQLRTFPSIKRFVVRAYSGRPIVEYMETMQGLGWEVLPAIGDSW